MPILGYIAPPQRMIKVPDSASGTGGGGFSMLPSIESWLQAAVQEMVGGPGENDEAGVSSLKWPDAQVAAHLGDVVAGRAPSLTAPDGTYFDPDADPARSAGLIIKYTRVFRQAVSTPAPPPLPPWMQPRVKPAE
jgi:hypothetical protein